jgi:hypothetical protein
MMDTQGIKISGMGERLTDSQLEKAISLIQNLPKNTFISTSEGKRNVGEEPTFMKAKDLDIQYSPEANIITLKGKIGTIFHPEGSTKEVSGPRNTYFNYKNTRYGIWFK